MYGFALCAEPLAETVGADDPDAITISGGVYDGLGEPLAYPEALVELWHGDQLARARTDAFGIWLVRLRRPRSAVDLPDGCAQAPHVNVTVWARGLLKQAQTRLYFPDEEIANASDPVLARVDPARRQLLLATPSAPRELRFDVHLQGEHESVFFDF